MFYDEMFWENIKRKWRMFFSGLAMFLAGGFFFLRWQQVKASVIGQADVPLISGYAVSSSTVSMYPIYQVLGLTGLLTLFIGLVMLVLSFR